MAQRIIFETLTTLTYEEIQEAVLTAAKKKNRKLGYTDQDLYVHFRWGTPMDQIFATIDTVKEIQEFDEDELSELDK